MAAVLRDQFRLIVYQPALYLIMSSNLIPATSSGAPIKTSTEVYFLSYHFPVVSYH